MSIRRYYIPNALVFITQVVWQRRPVFADEALVDLLRATLHRVKDLHPFSMLGYVFLPDHLHLLVKPEQGTTFSQVMHSLKPNLTKAYKRVKGYKGPVRLWQRRFSDHVIRDQEDLNRHLDYIHYNPVKHGLVAKPEEWAHSSFQAWKDRGAYPDGWGCSEPETVTASGEMGE